MTKEEYNLCNLITVAEDTHADHISLSKQEAEELLNRIIYLQNENEKALKERDDAIGRLNKVERNSGTNITNQGWLATLTPQKWWDVMDWLYHTYGRQYADSRLAIIDWLKEEHKPICTHEWLIKEQRWHETVIWE